MTEIQELKVSLKYSQEDINEINDDQTKYSTEAKDLGKQTRQIKSKPLDSKDNSERLGYLENQTQKNNVVIETCKGDETWAETETTVKAQTGCRNYQLYRGMVHLGPRSVHFKSNSRTLWCI